MRTYEELSKFAYEHIYPTVERLDPEICSEMPYTVDAEWLHEKLQIKKSFRAWIRFLKKDGMVENTDYYTSWQTMAGTLKPVKVYHIMLENVLVICRNMDTEISNVFYDFYYEFMLSMIAEEVAWEKIDEYEERNGVTLGQCAKYMVEELIKSINMEELKNGYCRS